MSPLPETHDAQWFHQGLQGGALHPGSSRGTADPKPTSEHMHRCENVCRGAGGLQWQCTHIACYRPLAQEFCETCTPGFTSPPVSPAIPSSAWQHIPAEYRPIR